MLLRSGPRLKTPSLKRVNELLNNCIDQYSTTNNITVFCGTYNLNGKLPHEDSLLSWIYSNSLGYTTDICVVGVQELIQLTPGEVNLFDF